MLTAKVHCPSCDREWIENVFDPEHMTGGTRTCPFVDCQRKGIYVNLSFPDSGKRSLKENWR